VNALNPIERPTRTRDLLCYAHGFDDSWEAICIDLDLSVQGQSATDVMAKMSEVITSYCSAALAEDPEVAEQLLARRAPASVRLSHWIRFQWHMLTRNRQQSRGSAVEFDIKVPQGSACLA
jgi:hypothetical protein